MKARDYAAIVAGVALSLGVAKAAENQRSIVGVWENPWAKYSGVDSIYAEQIKKDIKCDPKIDSSRALECFIKNYGVVSWKDFKKAKLDTEVANVALAYGKFCNENPFCYSCTDESYQSDLAMFRQLDPPLSIWLKLENAYRYMDTLSLDETLSSAEKDSLIKERFTPIMQDLAIYMIKMNASSPHADSLIKKIKGDAPDPIPPQEKSKPDSGRSSLENYLRARGEKLANRNLHREPYFRRQG
jgi:hypothetical protein